MKRIAVILSFLLLVIHAQSTTTTIIVAKSGGDYTTIQAAVDAASAGDTILIYPGTYAETLTIQKNVNLVGVTSDTCIITRNFAQSGAASFGDGTVNIGGGALNLASISNLTIQNTGAAPAATIALYLGAGKIYISNSTIWGNGRDNVTAGGSPSNHYFENCRIYSVSAAHTVWIYNGNSEFRDCSISVIFPYPTVQFTTPSYTKSGTFLNCWMRGASLFDCDGDMDDTLTVDNIYSDTPGAVLMDSQNATLYIGRLVGVINNATSYNEYGHSGVADWAEYH